MSMSNVSLNVIKELQRQVERSNKVCKHDIISLEEFVGEPIVSSKVNVDKLTVVPSSIGAADVLEALNEGVDKYNKLAQGPSLDEIREILMLMYNETLPGLRVIAAVSLPAAFLKKATKAALSEKIIYRYDDNNELIDVTTLPLDVVYDKYKDYFKDAYTAIHKTSIGFELPVIDPTYISGLSRYWNALVNLVESDDLYASVTKTPRPITIRDMFCVIENSKQLQDKVNAVEKLIAETVSPNNALEATPAVLGYVDIYNTLTDQDYAVARNFFKELIYKLITKVNVADAIDA